MSVSATTPRASHKGSLCALLLLACLHCSPNLAANGNTPEELEEYQAKALLIYNIAKFVIWPEEAFQQHPSHFIIDIAGQNPFDGAFYFLSDKLIQGREVVVETDHKLLPKNYQVLYVDSVDATQFTRELASLQKRNVLVVTSNPLLFDAGAMVYLGVDQEQLIFRVNLASAREAKLEISGNLLRLADQVIFDPNNGGIQ